LGKFSFGYCPLFHEISSRIHHLPHFGRLACHPSPTLSFCASPDLCSVLAAPLGDWLVTPCLLSAFVALPTFIHKEFGSLPHPVLQGRFSVPLPTSAVVVRLQFATYAFQFCWRWGFSLPRGCTGLCSQVVDRGVVHDV
jgi:hypothetical protein